MAQSKLCCKRKRSQMKEGNIICTLEIRIVACACWLSKEDVNTMIKDAVKQVNWKIISSVGHKHTIIHGTNNKHW